MPTDSKKSYLIRAAGILTLILGMGMIYGWLRMEPARHLTISVPGEDNTPPEFTAGAFGEKIDIGTLSQRFLPDSILNSDFKTVIPSEFRRSSWPSFRGPDRNGISTETTALADDWPDTGPPVLWSIELGEGHAGAAIHKGRVYVLDYDEEQKADLLRCILLETGQEIWQLGYPVTVKRNHGMSRTVPAVTDDFVVTIGPRCQVMCADARNGEFLWGFDLPSEYDTVVPLWYTGQCPVIIDDVAVIAPGGRALMIGVDCRTGEVLWETPNPRQWQMSHSSVQPMAFDGKQMLVYSAIGGIFAVQTDGPDQGKLLWESDLWHHNVLAPTPVPLAGGQLFLTAGYSAGSMLMQLYSNGETFRVDSLAAWSPKDGLASEQQTPIYYDGYLFTVLPKDAGNLHEQLVCSPAHNPREVVWASGSDQKFGLGGYIAADGKILIMDDTGRLAMFRLSTQSCRLLDSAQVLDGHDAWGPPAISRGRLIVRDSRHMLCLDLRKEPASVSGINK